MIDLISNTGYWNSNIDDSYHFYSKELAEWIYGFLKANKIKDVYDFGCGRGDYLEYLRLKGIKNLTGFEGDPPLIKSFDNIKKVDLTFPLLLEKRDFVISLEVGEHIPRRYMNVYLDNITNACKNYLLLSWAIPNQPGFGHINCLDNEVVIKEVEKRGFVYCDKESKSARDVIQYDVRWLKNTIIVFKKVDYD